MVFIWYLHRSQSVGMTEINYKMKSENTSYKLYFVNGKLYMISPSPTIGWIGS